jgi:hypothetical protein
MTLHYSCKLYFIPQILLERGLGDSTLYSMVIYRTVKIHEIIEVQALLFIKTPAKEKRSQNYPDAIFKTKKYKIFYSCQ